MPCFLMFTNLPKSKIPPNFLKDTTDVIADAIRKPAEFITVRIHPDQMMTHGGTNEPCANSELQSIGNISLEENEVMSKKIADYLQKKLGIDSQRNYIKFTDLEQSTVGYGGTTFDSIFGGRSHIKIVIPSQGKK